LLVEQNSFFDKQDSMLFSPGWKFSRRYSFPAKLPLVMSQPMCAESERTASSILSGEILAKHTFTYLNSPLKKGIFLTCLIF
jgi:hypothetical protein